LSKKHLSVNIAGLTIKVDSAVDFARFADFGFYGSFITDGRASYDCRLDHKISPPPGNLPPGDNFGPENWRLSRSGSKNVLTVGPAQKKGSTGNVVVFNSDYSAGTMYQESVSELFRRFIDQFLVINLLSRRDGFLLHASGVVWNGKGICFIGPSGAGKSTLLDLFGKEVPRESLLNDDRVALRRSAGKWRVFGTPWYGESRVSSPAGASLSTLFFIRHSKKNYVRKLSGPEVCRHLMVQALVPLWDEEATSNVLSTFEDLISSIPAYELGFLPDESAVSLVKNTV
jgi:hypothetical protein